MITFDPTSRTYISTLIDPTLFTVAFGTRLSDSESQLKEFDISKVSMNQVHGTDIQYINETDIQNGLKTADKVDGLATDMKGVALVCETADCVPVIVVDPKNMRAAIVHAGWKGSLGRVVGKMVQTLEAHGSDHNQLIAAVGPSIGACCYDIPQERAELFWREFAPVASSIIEVREDKHFLNLTALNVYQLREVGLEKAHIDFFPFCTSCHEDMFYSFRRDGSTEREMKSFIKIK